jgi:hypothetical protein
MTLVLQQEVIHSHPLIQRHTMQQRSVSFRMGYHHIRGGKDDLTEAPDPGSGSSGLASASLGEPLDELRRCQSRRTMANLQKPAAAGAARVRIGLHDLVAARDTGLPAGRSLGFEPHLRCP